jgi:nodulation protein F
MSSTLSREIIATISEYSDVEADKLSGETEIGELGIHSLELTEIIMELEEKYDVAIEIDTVEAWNSLKTIDDIVNAVSRLLAEKV